jgi:NAD(P)-dependent dehydrogenase (short-subunit alcohol dehydrogenase family)
VILPVDPAELMALSERVVLVTGATGVLGGVVVEQFAAAGARLGLIGTSLERLHHVAGHVGLGEDRWLPAVADLRQAGEAQAAVAAIAGHFGRLDILLHLVGGWVGGMAVADLDPAELSGMLDQHLWTTLNIAQAVLPLMLEGGWGRIVAIGSRSALEPGPKVASYAVAKAAEDTLLRTLAREVAGTGLTVNLVTVGTIDEEHQRDSAGTPLNATWTEPEEIAAALVYLCSDAAGAINGARLPLDRRG